MTRTTFAFWGRQKWAENSDKMKYAEFMQFSACFSNNYDSDDGINREITVSQQNQMWLLEKVFFHILILLIGKYGCCINK